MFATTDLWDESKWTDAVHLGFEGYDISPHWDDEGNSYVVGSHAWKVALATSAVTCSLADADPYSAMEFISTELILRLVKSLETGLTYGTVLEAL
jgi:hypothetical protein